MRQRRAEARRDEQLGLRWRLRAGPLIALCLALSACAVDLGVDEVPYACDGADPQSCGAGFQCVQSVCQPITAPTTALDTSSPGADTDAATTPDTTSAPDTTTTPDTTTAPDTTTDTADTITTLGCGDGILNGDELCDGNQFGGATCTSVFGQSSGNLQCSETCRFVATGCYTCGNGNAEPAEQCDGNNLNGQTCASIGRGFASGDLACDAHCAFDTSACSRCGNQAVEAGEACDGDQFGGLSCEGLGFSSQGQLLCLDGCARVSTEQCVPEREIINIGAQAAAFRRLPPGTFTMGSPPSEPGRMWGRTALDETPHQVTLTRAFWVKETEVTQAEWSELMPNSAFAQTLRNPTYPAINVTWLDALAFANALSTSQDLTPCYDLSRCTGTPGVLLPTNAMFTCPIAEDLIPSPDCLGYRLPTEAEWEYAARAGTSTAFYSGPVMDNLLESCQTEPTLDQIGWYCANYADDLHAVGGKIPSGWRLYDTSGNVWEWVWDWAVRYDANPPPSPVDPVRTESAGLGRVLRGGGFFDAAFACRAAFRLNRPWEQQDYNIGFRLVRTAAPPTPP